MATDSSAAGEQRSSTDPELALRPREVVVSFWLWVIYFLLGGFGIVMVLVDGRPAVSMLGVAVVSLILLAGLCFAFFMREGRDWARIALAVWGSLQLLAALFSLIVGNVASLVALLLVGAAMVAMFRPAANAWFAARRR